MDSVNLFQHQQKALDLTKSHNRCAYYLDMGLGKTFVGSEKLMKLNTGSIWWFVSVQRFLTGLNIFKPSTPEIVCLI